MGGRRCEDVFLSMGADFHAHRVEEILVRDGKSELFKACRQRGRMAMHTLGDPHQTFRSVVHGIHACHHRQQHLRRAHIAGRLLAPDVLLARLQRHAQRRLALGVSRHTDDATGQQAFELIARGKKRGVGTAVAHRHAEPLRVADHDVGAPLTRWCQKAQRKKIARHRDQRAGGMRLFAQPAIIHHGAVGARILQQRAEHRAVEGQGARIAHLHHDAAR